MTAIERAACVSLSVLFKCGWPARSKICDTGMVKILDELRSMRLVCSDYTSPLQYSSERMIPKNPEEERNLKRLKVPTPSDPRFLSVAIVGLPNAGKSALTNALMGWRVASVSRKVHTTLRNTNSVIVEENAQIVLSDTPGIISRHEKRKHNLQPEMLTEPKESVSNADLVIAVVDASNKWNRHRLDGKVLELLKQSHLANKPSVLVLNKVDLISSKNVLLEVTHSLTDGVVGSVSIASRRIIKTAPKPTNELEPILKRANAIEETDCPDETKAADKEPLSPPSLVSTTDMDAQRSNGWPHFDRVFMVSALTKDGIHELKAYLLSQTKEHNWKYSPHVVTNEKSQEIIQMAVREKLLDHLPQEIPYNLVLAIESLEVEQPSFMRISVSIKVPQERQMKLVIGGGGSIIRQIVSEARQELMDTFHCDILLKLIVQCSQKRLKIRWTHMLNKRLKREGTFLKS